jgi:hypothetical protein
MQLTGFGLASADPFAHKLGGSILAIGVERPRQGLQMGRCQLTIEVRIAL